MKFDQWTENVPLVRNQPVYRPSQLTDFYTEVYIGHK